MTKIDFSKSGPWSCNTMEAILGQVVHSVVIIMRLR